MSRLQKIRVIAVDTNGVLLNDIYAASLCRFVTRHGGIYTAELESIVLGAPHMAGGHALSVACGLALTADECIQYFLEEHKAHAAANPVVLYDAAVPFLKRMHGLGARVTTYGGRARDALLGGLLAPCLPWLDEDVPYVDMDSFRPGMKEIARDFFACRHEEIVFIDDLNKVANAARSLGSGFIGVPSTQHQRAQMLASGVADIFDSIDNIGQEDLLRVDQLLQRSPMPLDASPA